MRHWRAGGKIAHGEWAAIVARYQRGESIAQISRDYGCTAPAIRYIIKRSGRFRTRADPPKPDPARYGHRTAVPPPRSDHILTDAGGGLLDPKVYHLITQDLFRLLAIFDQPYASEAQSLNAVIEAAERLIVSAARVRVALERLSSR